MKKSLFCLLCTVQILLSESKAQNIAINTDGSLPDASSMLDIKSTSKGLLAPRMTTTQQNAISSPANGLLIFNTTDNVFRVNTGTAGTPIWTAMNATNDWLLTGNSGSNPATNFLGTTDDKQMILKSNGQPYLEFGRRQTLGLTQPFPDYTDNDEKVTYVRSALQFEAPNASFYKPKMFTDANGNFRVKGSAAGTDFFEFGSTGTNNNGGFEFIIGDDGDEPMVFKSYHYINGMSEIMRLQSGRMAVGSNSFNATNPEKLLIDAGVTNSYNLMTGKGNIDNYLQINVQNQSNGNNASSDIVATANNGDETINYVDLGINGGSYTGGYMGTANDGYLYSKGNNFLIATGNASKSLIFMTGGTSQAVNERMRIDGSGNVGMGVTSPLAKLHVSATSNPLLLGGLQTGTSADSLLTVSNGVVKRLSPSALAVTNAWALAGSTGSASTKLGTTGNFDLPIITNNTTKMTITSGGNVGIGSTGFNATNPEKLLVDAGNTSSFNVISGKGSIDNYLQLNIQNNSAGTNASSDLVATANNGNETTNYVDMGINGGNYSGGVMGGANDSYLYNVGQNFLIASTSAAKSLVFMTGGTTQSTNERMRIDGSGNVGIGTISPNSTLSIKGSQSVSFRSGTGAYTVLSTDYVVINTGGSTPTWTLPLANTCSGRVYLLMNHGTTSVTISQAITIASGTTSTTLANAAGSNSYEIISDGSVWRKMN